MATDAIVRSAQRRHKCGENLGVESEPMAEDRGARGGVMYM